MPEETNANDLLNEVLIESPEPAEAPVPTPEQEQARVEAPVMEAIAAAESKFDSPIVEHPAVKVSLKIVMEGGRGGYEVVQLNCNYNVPDLPVVAQNLSKTHQAVIRRYVKYNYSLEDTILRYKDSIPVQAWTDAIAAAIIVKETNLAGATTEMKNLQYAYLAMGDQIFKLSPIGMAPQTKALTVARKHAMEKAVAEAKSIVANAKMSAATILQNARMIRQESEELLKRTRREVGAIPPRWVREQGLNIRWNGNQQKWETKFSIYFQITHWDVGYASRVLNRQVTYTWPALPMEPKKIDLWLPLESDGTYAMTSIHVDRDSVQIPHIGWGAACLSPGDAPRKVRTLGELELLKGSMERCLRRVQLNSLRVATSEWLETFKEALPEDLYKALKEANYWNGAVILAERNAQQAQVVDNAEEERTTWTTNG